MNSNRPPNPDNAPASLIIDGISLYCLPDDEKMQIAFIREPNHTLSLKIIELSAQNDETPVAHTINLTPGQEIFLEASSPTQDNCSTFEAQGFDRRNLLKDFRFVTDLDGELHHRQLELRDPKQFDITLLTVNNAHFYVRTLFGPVKAVERPSGAKRDFGLIADTVGADILCADEAGSKVIIKNANDQHVTELVLQTGVRYRIIFQNICDVDVTSNITDFGLCYSLVQDPNNITFDLQSPTLLQSGNDACNGGRVMGGPGGLASLLSIATAAPQP